MKVKKTKISFVLFFLLGTTFSYAHTGEAPICPLENLYEGVVPDFAVDQGINCPSASLSKDQVASMYEAWEKFKASYQGISKAKWHEAKLDLMQSILDTVPKTKEQRIMLEKCMDCPSARLSEEQVNQLHEIWEEYKSRAYTKIEEGLMRIEMTGAERRKAKAETRQKMLDTVPETEEQRNALSACMHSRNEYYCPSANLSEMQYAKQFDMWWDFNTSEDIARMSEEERHKAKLDLIQNILDTLPNTEEQRSALLECMNQKKKTKNS